VEETLKTLQNALGTYNADHGIDLISIRVIPPLGDNDEDDVGDDNSAFHRRLIELIREIMRIKKQQKLLSNYQDYKVVVNDHVEAAVIAQADGVHVKERHVKDIPLIRAKFEDYTSANIAEDEERRTQESSIIIGTSAHTIESAVENWKCYQPDYFFVGTCYLTQSHPEKDAAKLEGPTLPGLVKRCLLNETGSGVEGRTTAIRPPVIFAIGGIESSNCHEPVKYGADGVAVIRSVMQASNPADVVQRIKSVMNESKECQQSY